MRMGGEFAALPPVPCEKTGLPVELVAGRKKPSLHYATPDFLWRPVALANFLRLPLRMSDAHYLQSTWETITSQVKVDKVYIETWRSGKLADDQLLEQVKKFFLDRGVAVAGGMGLTVNEANNFQSIFILTVPDNYSDLYSYPPAVVSGIKNFVLGDFPVRLDGPNEASLFAYDNHTFVVESYLDHPTAVTRRYPNYRSLPIVRRRRDGCALLGQDGSAE